MTLTATATPQRIKEIISSLGIHNATVIETNPTEHFFKLKWQLSKGDDKLQAIWEPLIDELKAKWEFKPNFKCLFNHQ